MKIIIASDFQKVKQEAFALGLSPTEFVAVTPFNWDIALRGMSYRWDDLVYGKFPPEAFPEQFYTSIKVGAHHGTR